MYTVIVEIRAAEGGADAKDLVLLQAGIYLKYAAMQKLLWEPLETRPGFLSARLSGPADILKRFSQSEPGGHRWQRVPPTERKGRVHTSTITTSVLREPTQAEVHLNPGDLEWKTTRSGGPGGQHANKTASAVVLTHGPSGIRVRIETSKSQHRNKDTALQVLRAKLMESQKKGLESTRNSKRKKQVGHGMRADKRRTTRIQSNQVVDHITGQRMTVRRYLKGFLEELWD